METFKLKIRNLVRHMVIFIKQVLSFTDTRFGTKESATRKAVKWKQTNFIEPNTKRTLRTIAPYGFFYWLSVGSMGNSKYCLSASFFFSCHNSPKSLFLLVTNVTKYLSGSNLQKEGFIILPNSLRQNAAYHIRERAVAEHKATGVWQPLTCICSQTVESRSEA